MNKIFSQFPSIFDFKFYDLSTWSLVCANLLIIILALLENWNLSMAMLIYWFQSVIIGIFNVARIVTFTGFQQLDKTEDKRGARLAVIFLASFFAVHYGGFHWGYWSFLRGWTRNIDMKMVLIPSGIFFLNHLFSFLYNFKRDRQNQDPRGIVRLMFFPYGRIVPMHLTIIVGMFIYMVASFLKWNFAETLVLIFFLLLKTGADVKMHLVEHRFNLSQKNNDRIL